MATLASYQAAAQRLLKDSSASATPLTDLTAFINDAIKQRDRDSGMNRQNQTITLTVGQTDYTINQAPFSTSTIGIVSAVLIYNNARSTLARLPWSWIAAGEYQPTTTYQSTPAAFCQRGALIVSVAPKPSQAFQIEFDTMVVSADLVNGTDADPLPYPWTDPVPWLTAHFAKVQLQQYDEAQNFLAMYYQRLNGIQTGTFGQMISRPRG
jgi:hypothetical protein